MDSPEPLPNIKKKSQSLGPQRGRCFCFRSPIITFLLAAMIGLSCWGLSLVLFPPKAGEFIKIPEAGKNFEEVQRFFIGPQLREKESPELCLIERNSLAAVSPPIMVSPRVMDVLVEGANFDEEELQKEIREYIVQPGDSLSSIALNFNISLQTVLWANDLNKNSIIRPGQKLVILPVSGLIHYVEKGDSLSEISETYKADLEEILAFNNISGSDNILEGDILVIPDGVMPPRPGGAPVLVPLASSYFICPISSPCRVTQGLHWYNAVDFSHEGIGCGEPVFAAAGGLVQRTGYTAVGGNFVRLLHPNGVVTYYGHLQSILVKTGQEVSQGDIIGYIGHTGYTRPAGAAGCHLHFDVRGSRNPFAY